MNKSRTLNGRLAGLILGTIIGTWLLLGAGLAHGQGVGGVVSDPGSYSYYVEQLEQMRQQLSTLRKNLEEMSAVRNTMVSMREELNRAYNNTFGLIGSVNRVVKELEQVDDSFAKGVANITKEAKCVVADLAYYERLEHTLDAVYNPDPKAHRKDPCAGALPNRYQARQDFYRATLLSTRAGLDQNKEDMKTLKKLVQKAANTKNPKDAQDLTNAILLELYKVVSRTETSTHRLANMTANQWTGEKGNAQPKQTANSVGCYVWESSAQCSQRIGKPKSWGSFDGEEFANEDPRFGEEALEGVNSWLGEANESFFNPTGAR